MKIQLAALFLASCLTFVARAATLASDPADNCVKGSDSDLVDNWDLTIGGQGAYDRAVIPFLLPTLGAGSFSNASFSFELNAITPADFNFGVDVHGLTRMSTLPAVFSTDNNGGTTLLETAIVDTLSHTGPVTTSDSAGVSAWLNAQYANGANAGQYVFIGLEARINTGSPIYSFYSANHPATGVRPFGTYTFTAVPEPSAYGLLGVAALGLTILKRRRK